MILAIVGPTGVGKTRLSIELAKKYHAVIINADAVQVYKGLNIGTAKVKEEEKEGIPHFLLDIVDPSTNYTVYQYQKDARSLLEKYKGKNVIFVGGTGLYLKSALYDYRFKKDIENDGYDDLSNEKLYELCLKKDPNCIVHPHNRVRLLRFLKRSENDSLGNDILYPCLFIGLTTDRETLYQKINERVDKMMEDNLLDEVSSFYNQKEIPKPVQTAIGYKEWAPFFKNEKKKDECIEEIKKNSRHYAKRQYTFFRNQFPVTWFESNYKNFNETVEEVIKYIEKKKKELF